MGYVPQVGHRIKRSTVIVGEVTSVNDNSVCVRPDGCLHPRALVASSSDGATVTWERLPDPEPEHEFGLVVKDATGAIFIYADRLYPRPWLSGSSPRTGLLWFRDAELQRPLTVLFDPSKPAADDA